MRETEEIVEFCFFALFQNLLTGTGTGCACVHVCVFYLLCVCVCVCVCVLACVDGRYTRLRGGAFGME